MRSNPNQVRSDSVAALVSWYMVGVGSISGAHVKRGVSGPGIDHDEHAPRG